MWLFAKSIPIRGNILTDAAALDGHVNILEYLFRLYPKLVKRNTRSIMSQSAEKGRLNILKWVQLNYLGRFTEHIKFIASIAHTEGHFDIVHWLIDCENGNTNDSNERLRYFEELGTQLEE